jgi:hypothetical protein
MAENDKAPVPQAPPPLVNKPAPPKPVPQAAAAPVKPAPAPGTPAKPAQPVPRPTPPTAPPPRTPQQAAANISTAKMAMASYGPIAGARADLFYGDTNTTKTTQLGWVAQWLKQKYDQPSRLISADPGGWEAIQADVDDGTIQAFALNGHRTNLYETVEKLCLGFWPKDPMDSESPLLPPRDNGLKDIAGVFFEGLKSICDLLMRVHTVDIQNISVPEMPDPTKTRISSGSYIQRFTGRSDYMGIGDAIAAFVRDSGMLPVKKVIWTSQEQQGHNEKTNQVFYGPDIVGQKPTQNCGPWFGNLIHMDMVPVSVQVPDPLNPQAKITVQRPAPFMFLRSHIDPADPFKRSWPAKTRAPRQFWQDVPDFMEARADKFYTFMEQLLAKEKASKLAQQQPQP